MDIYAHIYVRIRQIWKHANNWRIIWVKGIWEFLNALPTTFKFEIISIWKLFLNVKANSQSQIVSEKDFFFPKWLIF